LYRIFVHPQSTPANNNEDDRWDDSAVFWQRSYQITVVHRSLLNAVTRRCLVQRVL
jgi:hypothetical protein